LRDDVVIVGRRRCGAIGMSCNEGSWKIFTEQPEEREVSDWIDVRSLS
jgi:hypothetical protein